MVEYNKVNVKFTDKQLKNTETAVKNKTRTTLRISLEMLNGNDLITDNKTKTKLRNAFNDNMPTNIKLLKTHISKIIQSGGFLGSLLSKLPGTLMKVAIPLAKNVLAPLGITAVASTIDKGIQKKIHGSGTSTLIISNEEINDIIKIV